MGIFGENRRKFDDSLTNVREHNNADVAVLPFIKSEKQWLRCHERHRIWYSRQSDEIKWSDRCEKWQSPWNKHQTWKSSKVSNAEEDDDHNSAEIQKNKSDENSKTATVSGNHESNKEPNDEVTPYLHYHTFPNAYSFLDLGEIPYLLSTETIPVSVKKLKFKVHRGQVQKDFIDAFTGLDM